MTMSYLCNADVLPKSLSLLGIPGVAFLIFKEFAFIYFFLGRKTHGANCWSYTESSTQPVHDHHTLFSLKQSESAWS